MGVAFSGFIFVELSLTLTFRLWLRSRSPVLMERSRVNGAPFAYDWSKASFLQACKPYLSWRQHFMARGLAIVTSSFLPLTAELYRQSIYRAEYTVDASQRHDLQYARTCASYLGGLGSTFNSPSSSFFALYYPRLERPFNSTAFPPFAVSDNDSACGRKPHP